MEEKIIIQSESVRTKYRDPKVKQLRKKLGVALLICIGVLALYFVMYFVILPISVFNVIIDDNVRNILATIFGIIPFFSAIALLIAILILLILGRPTHQITVTDKRVYGIAAHKSRVDLPLDSVSAVATSAFKGLSVATSSGRITFIGIKNRDEIHKVISDLLIERQSKPKAVVQEEKPAAPSNVAEQLKQLKELVDAGILTQEEFDAKKKQLLGL